MSNGDVANVNELYIDMSKNQSIPMLTEAPKNQISHSDLRTEINDKSASMWGIRGKHELYQRGVLLGSSKNKPDFNEFIKKFHNCFEEIIRNELKKSNKTSEDFSPDFKALFYMYNIIAKDLNVNKVDMSSEDFIAIFHGFINSYLTSTIK